jgi:hypothetical protein
MDKEIDLQLVLERFPPGDRWVPKGKDTPIFSSLTEGIEWVFQNTQARDYLVKAAEGKVYVYNEFEKPEPEPEPPKRYNIYGEYE